MKNYTIFLDSPASEWELATPVGCGGLGAMLYGTVNTECLQLNEEHIWAGKVQNTDFPDFSDIIQKIRQLLLDGNAPGADAYAEQALRDKFYRVKSYETAGELYFEQFTDGVCENYRRELDLISGVASVAFKKGGVNYRRELFASYPSRLIAFRFSADKKDAVSFTVRYERENIVSKRAPDGGTLEIKGATACGSHTFTVLIKVIPTGGFIETGADKIKITGADFCDVYITAAFEKEPAFTSTLKWDELKITHTADFSALMGRSDIIFKGTDDKIEALPVSGRLARVKTGETDAPLVSLYYQFGKYLLVSSSRPGTLPANLQGVWNGYYEAPWNSDYHTNINLQMNYWPAEAANLSECAIPLFDYINNYLLESGRRTAEINYRCRGTVLHHLSDLYNFTAPADGLWGLWPLGGAWLCLHFWEHYLYTLDADFLRNTAYGYISGCARFFLDYMFEKDGALLSGPSTSPENRYFCGGKPSFLCLSPTMDTEIIGCLLRLYIETEKLLCINLAQAEEAERAIKKLPPLKIGKHGQLMEWLEDYDEPEPGHRHISHMFALYPDSAINPSTPALFEAARKSLLRRLAHGGGHTGWSCAWLVALFARLGDGEAAMENLNKLLSKSTRDNLFDTHPPFQIDGNFGGCAAIIELVMQSHNGTISLLPALPGCFSEGEFIGLRARGGAEVSARWKNGAVTEFSLTSDMGGTYAVRFNGETAILKCGAGEKVTYKI